MTPLAVIGVGCRFPGSRGPEEFWRSLRSGREQLAATPPYRARLRAQGDPRASRPGIARRGTIGDVSRFDWRAFRMSPRECRHTDPQQRVLLETAWEALEDAGLPFERVAATRTAVFVGIMWPDYAKLLAESARELAGYATSGVGFALAANRISHFFDLRGPSVALDVQCASSLTAVHLAARAIWSGEADLALAGGVNLILTQDSDYMMSRAGILSRAGRCATFDADADGFVRSEGAGLIVLKPLAAARADGDRVLALLRGSALNHDGRTVPLTAPSKDSQVALIADACASAGVRPSELDYVELHGTGTQKGDPLEAWALGEAVGSRRAAARPCLVGSVKTNIGHCEAAAGVASVIKTVLSLHRREIPPTINHRRTNPEIDERALGIRLVTEPTPWPRRGGERLAGVTGLSLGGGNAHVILAEASSPRGGVAQPASGAPFPLLLPISARTRPALTGLARAYATFLRTPSARGQVEDICYTAALRRSHHEHRTVAAARTAEGLADRLAAFAEHEPRAERRRLPGVEARPPRVLFVMPHEHGIDAPRALVEGLRRLSIAAGAVVEAGGGELGPALLEAMGEGPAVVVAPPGGGGGDLARRLSGVLARAGRDARLMCLGEGEASLWRLACELYVAGCPLDWGPLFPRRGTVVSLPLYAWDRERLWADPASGAATAGRAPPARDPRFACAHRRLVEGAERDG